MRYFITGATGFIGGHMVRQLREQGHEVVALVRSPAKATDLAALGAQLAAGDITDKASVKAAMQGVDGCSMWRRGIANVSSRYTLLYPFVVE
ncbi:MAG: SDR family oxidoreductase [Phototrophicaceae bacterium]|jgi:uncharacterized protein YbjT (DUF2867 family)